MFNRSCSERIKFEYQHLSIACVRAARCVTIEPVTLATVGHTKLLHFTLDMEALASCQGHVLELFGVLMSTRS